MAHLFVELHLADSVQTAVAHGSHQVCSLVVGLWRVAIHQPKKHVVDKVFGFLVIVHQGSCQAEHRAIVAAEKLLKGSFVKHIKLVAHCRPLGAHLY